MARRVPSALRSVGFLFLRNYFLGVPAALLWLWFISLPIMSVQTGIFSEFSKERLLAALPADPEGEAVTRFPDPELPLVLDITETDITAMREAAQAERSINQQVVDVVRQWSSENDPITFLSRPFLKPYEGEDSLPEAPYDFSSRLQNLGRTASDKSISNVLADDDFRSVYCRATFVPDSRGFSNRAKDIAGELGKSPDWHIEFFYRLQPSLDMLRTDGEWVRSHSSEEVAQRQEQCLSEPLYLNEIITGLCIVSDTQAAPCGAEFQAFVRSIAELIDDNKAAAALDLGAEQTALRALELQLANREQVSAQYELNLSNVEQARAAFVANVAQRRAQLEGLGFTAEQGNVVRFFLYGLAFTLITVWVFFGAPFSLFQNPFTGQLGAHYYRVQEDGDETKSHLAELPYAIVKDAHWFGLLCLVALFVSFFIWGGFSIGTTLASFVAFSIPAAFFAHPAIWLGGREMIEEHPFIQKYFRGKLPDARFQGLWNFVRKDFGFTFFRNREGIVRSETSDIYLGRTSFSDDSRMLGRHVGLIGSERHMLTVAAPRSGKSRDAIWNTLLSYSGGLVCFDPKGEHFRVTAKRRATYAKTYVIDPFGYVSDIAETHFWNPLDEIDLNDISAKEQLEQVAKASIFADFKSIDTFFEDNGALIFRGFIAHVLTKYKPKDRHLGTVYDLLKTGEPEGKFYTKHKWDLLLERMKMNYALGGAARDAASLLSQVGERERGSYLSTMARGIDWVNSKAVRRVISKPSTFSLREAKSKEASVYLVLPEDFIESQKRFLRTFYSIGLMVCGEYFTPQPKGSKRRVLFLFDEFNALGRFDPAVTAINVKAGAFIKCWFISHNIGQIDTTYGNPANFFSGCDKQFFAVDDESTFNLMQTAMGDFLEGEGKYGSPVPNEKPRTLMSNQSIRKWTNDDSNGQIVIPIGQDPMKIERVPYYKNFGKDQYGSQEKGELKTVFEEGDIVDEHEPPEPDLPEGMSEEDVRNIINEAVQKKTTQDEDKPKRRRRRRRKPPDEPEGIA